MKRYFEDRKLSIQTAILCILFVWLSYFTRALGISLVAALICYFIIERLLGKTDRNLKQVLLTILIITIPIGLWAYRCNMVQSFMKSASGGYGAEVGVADAATNILRRIEAHISVHFVANSFAPIIIYGIVWCLRRRRTVVEYYFIIFILILSVISGPAEKYTGDTMQHVRRYLVVIMPLTLYYFVMGVKPIIEALVSLDRKKLFETLAFLVSISFLLMIFYVTTEHGIRKFLIDYLSIMVLCALIAIFAILSAFSKRLLHLFSKNLSALSGIILYCLLCLLIFGEMIIAIQYIAGTSAARSPDWDEYISIAGWVKENTPLEALVASRLNYEFYLISGRRGENSRVWGYDPFTNTPEQQQQVLTDIKKILITYGFDYWILDNTREDSRVVISVLAQNPDETNNMFKIVYSYPPLRNTLAYVLEVNKEWVKKEKERRGIK